MGERADIVKRLRQGFHADEPVMFDGVLHDRRDLEAADEIERLREALGRVIECDHHNHYDGPAPRYAQIARAALGRQYDG